MSSTEAKVYIYPQGTQRPANPAYTFAISNWSPQLRFYNRVGNASIDNVSVKDRRQTFDYLYDDLNRLTKVTDINNSTVDYTYDAEGNRETKVTGEGTTNYHYTDANELDVVTKPDASTVNYTYDDNGNILTKTEPTNQTTTYTYDNKNQLVKVEKPNNDVIEYTYDGNGNRYKKTVTASGSAAVSRYYHYDTGGNILTETDENKNVLVRYVRDTSGKAISMIQGSDTYYFEYNAHGDVVALTDQSGTPVATYAYDEFGNLQSSTGNTYNPLRYSGANNAYYDSETGFYKMGARYYQSDVGRWLTRDKFKGFTPAPDTGNWYVYVLNNPITNIDPTGFVYARFNGKKFRVYHTNRKLWRSFRGITSAKTNEKKKYGRIPKGIWRMYANEITFRKFWWDSAWGAGRIPLHAIAKTKKYGRSGFFFHGGPWRNTEGCLRVDDNNWKWVARLLPKLRKQRMNLYVRY